MAIFLKASSNDGRSTWFLLGEGLQGYATRQALRPMSGRDACGGALAGTPVMRLVLSIDQTVQGDENGETGNDQEGSEEEIVSETRIDFAARGQALHPARRRGPDQRKR
ncbi:hypothetical protein JQ634_03850 [Bradyrhizobium sp. AUGA SZCCT0240]|uniref:hypothetical protein n=1 Tax=unclassified Bradyrhizobium TaxID=2631580 RepID=UPI001BA530F0|nr:MULTISPECIES: hypothetical protein [unclassified Bradyrhizobium]MBR1192064.1 hypothetical protein [Bradyrhizobium sp. AUGA SZCCT0160]MBR1245100.1 hypothetical protein [Bradyrhizobium sp. AUGA SZCCT0274]MBR1252828.1 hypothetical protein [Bradyrhizobium sp. AUGA SZCCT0240]